MVSTTGTKPEKKNVHVLVNTDTDYTNTGNHASNTQDKHMKSGIKDITVIMIV